MNIDLYKNSELDSEELSLRNFRLMESNISERPLVGRWVPCGEDIEIQSINVQGGNFYYHEGLIDAQSERIASATIESELPIIEPPEVHQNHYPWAYELSYRFLSKRDRWTYLNWLAGDRNLDTIDSDFVWIYIFGIERRLLIDTKEGVVEQSEIAALRKELQRIVDKFPKVGLSSVYDLLAYTWLLFSSDQPVRREFKKGAFSDSFYRFQIGRKARNGETLDAHLAWDWFLRFGREFKPPKRFQKQFKRLFKYYFDQSFSEGIVLQDDGSKLHLHFETLNPMLDFYRGATFDLPDLCRSKSVLGKLRKVAERSHEAFLPYRKYLSARHRNKKSDLKAFTLLPSILANSDNHTKAKEIQRWILSHHPIETEQADYFDISISKLNKRLGKGKFKTLGKRNLVFLSELLGRLGFLIAPDIELHSVKASMDGKLIAVSSDSSLREKGSKFDYYLLLIRFGLSVTVEEGMRKNYLEKKLQESSLSEDSKRSLLAFLYWYQSKPISFAGLKKGIQLLEATQLDDLAMDLVELALLEKGVDKRNSKELEKIYRLLGREKSDVIKDIHRAMAPTQNRKGMELDTRLVKAKENETAEVKSILSSIFIDDQDLGMTFSSTGLDEKYQSFFIAITAQSEWSDEQMNRLCKKFGLMKAGALERINDWAFETTDNPLIEFDGIYYIDLETLDELKQLAGGKHG